MSSNEELSGPQLASRAKNAVNALCSLRIAGGEAAQASMGRPVVACADDTPVTAVLSMVASAHEFETLIAVEHQRRNGAVLLSARGNPDRDDSGPYSTAGDIVRALEESSPEPLAIGGLTLSLLSGN